MRMAVTKIQSKMICPRCKVEMNHHCDKLVYGSGPQEAGPDDPPLDGTIAEFHACPKCGYGASRCA
jgi:ribosomal protein S27AE